ncbi:hypothetical protein F7725_009246 [Dissostichus mawsoni]|uniref:Uncharacterized protein n=1 Tax=Dissostichus mawsoni TaxID=36200 RepID=A0A7J5Z9M1_DISMA|nr:hypothetical protein F7725_009246 [Dissostichus mawsoni]
MRCPHTPNTEQTHAQALMVSGTDKCLLSGSFKLVGRKTAARGERNREQLQASCQPHQNKKTDGEEERQRGEERPYERQRGLNLTEESIYSFIHSTDPPTANA